MTPDEPRDEPDGLSRYRQKRSADTSPEPVTNGVANVAEAGVVAALVLFVWQHPWISLTLAIALLVALVLLLRLAWRTLARVVRPRRFGRPTG